MTKPIQFSWDIETDDPSRPCDCYANDDGHPEIEHFDCRDLFQAIRCGICHGCMSIELRMAAYKWGSCPWYRTRGLPDSKRLPCTFGCQTEPFCETMEPEGGWMRNEKWDD